MIYLLGSIILNSYLTLSFKVIQQWKVPLFQAVVFNYLTCVVTGSVMNGSFPAPQSAVGQPWFAWAGIMGCMFIMLFNLIGLTAQKLGVAVASVANKLSLVIPFAFSLYLYHEEATALKAAGIIIALAAVVFTCLPAHKNTGFTNTGIPPFLLILLPSVLFLGSGLLDALVKYVQQTYLNESNNNAYLITSFATATTIGLLVLLVLVITGKQRFDSRRIMAGIVIGVPNYFSLWCLVKVLKQYEGNSSAIIPINNMGIVLFSSVMAWLLFKERLSLINWAGVILAVGAIALIAFG